MNNYKIAFKGLSNGLHDFRFEVDRQLFDAFENNEISSATCSVDVVLNRSERQLLLDVKIAGEVVVPCDRCLEDCALPIDYEGELVVKFSDEEQEYDGEVMWLYPGDTEVDLAHYIYESILISLPYQRVHAEGACDPAMMERFRIVSAEEFSAIETEAAKEESGTMGGSEWDKLAALKEQMGQKED